MTATGVVRVTGFRPNSPADHLIADAFIFDLDGVLVASLSGWLEVERLATKRLGGSWNPDRSNQPAGLSPLEATKQLASRCQLHGREDELLAEVLRIAPGVFASAARPVPGALATVTLLGACCPVAIATSSPRAVADAVLAAIGLHEVVDAVVTCDDVPSPKPAPDVYLEAARRLGVDPRSCIAIDDTPLGVAAAVQAEMRVLAFGPKAQRGTAHLGTIARWDDLQFVTIDAGRRHPSR